jgi:hypothetical protein
MREVALDDPAWGRRDGDVRTVDFAGRSCITFGEQAELLGLPAGVELTDGVIEVDVAVSGERAFHGVVWRVVDRANYESFYVRPHQVGNYDSVQYNPVFNDVSSWQLYHEPGFWAAVRFPIGEWFTVRVVFAGSRAEIFVGDLSTPALIAPLKMPAMAGRVGILIGGPEPRNAAGASEQANRETYRPGPPIRIPTPPRATGMSNRDWSPGVSRSPGPPTKTSSRSPANTARIVNQAPIGKRTGAQYPSPW